MEKTPAWVWIGACAGAVILMVGAGMRHSFGIFLPPITMDQGWGREVFALGFAVQMILLGLAAPFAGMISDRFGAGRVLAFGTTLQALGILAVSQARSEVVFVLSAGVVMGIGSAAASNVVVIGAVGKMVGENRLSRAVGFLMTGASIGQIIILPIAHLLLTAYGWSHALLVLGLGAFSVIPLALVLARGALSASRPKSTQRISEALREAKGQKSYLFLTAGFFVCGFHVFFLAAHLPAYAQDQGLDPVVGANALMLIGLFNVIGTNAWGYLGDRFLKNRMLGLIYFIRAVAISLFISVPASTLTVYLFAAVMGFLWLGTVPLTSGIVARIFGPQYLAMLYGFVFLSHQVGGFLGAWMAGRLFDATGNYAVMWGLSIFLGLLAAMLHQPINEAPLVRQASAEAVG